MDFTLSSRYSAGNDPVVGLSGRSQKRACIALRRTSAENGVPGDQQLCSGLDDGGNGVVSHTAVHLDPEVEVEIAAEFDEATDLVQRKGDKLLPAKTRIHTHDEHVVNHGENIDQQIDASGRIDDHAGFHSVVQDHLQRAVQVRAGLVMDAEPVGARISEGGDELVGVIDHQVAVERQAGTFAQAGHHGWTDGDVGDEVAVHDVDVDGGAATALGRGNLVGQVCEIRG